MVGSGIVADGDHQLGLVKVIEETVPLPMPIDCGRPTLVDSWHMLEQSGKLLVPYSRANSWNRKAASLEARPEV
jgi:hypothetical protein